MFIDFNLNLFFCLVESKRKLRRNGKTLLQEPFRDKLKRILEFLNTGKLIDYTHTSEVDEVFKYIYKVYEVLFYTEKELKYLMFSKDNIDYFIYSLDSYSKKQILDVYIKIFILKKRLEFYITNFLNLIVAIVYKNKFYGWSLYRNDLTTEMFLSIFENIKKLKFNPEKAKGSVYIYQTAWLKGLYTSREILNNIKRTVYIKPAFDREDRGNMIFSESNQEIEYINDGYFEERYEKDNSLDNSEKEELNLNIDEILYQYLQYEDKEELMNDIEQLLKEKYNITFEDLHNLSDFEIKKIGKELRKILFN